MATMEQISVSLKGREIRVWNRLNEIYPSCTKHDIIVYAIISLLNKGTIKRSQIWKELRIFYPDIKNDWLFIRKVMEERLDERL